MSEVFRANFEIGDNKKFQESWRITLLLKNLVVGQVSIYPPVWNILIKVVHFCDSYVICNHKGFSIIISCALSI